MTHGGHAPHGRLHHLDALRAGAMFLGVVLHAALSFTDMEWAVKDRHAGAAPGIWVAATHGFRMQLFFLLSGYFSAGLLRNRGAAGYAANRRRRIGLPFLLACLTVLPATWAAMWFASAGAAPRAIADLLAGLPWVPWLLLFPLLGHLWFLWFLCWMAPVLPAAAWAARRAPWLRVPRPLVATPLCLLWLVPLTAVLAAPMGNWGTKPSFGADTFAGVLPMPHLLAYYGAFFLFGALAATVPGAMHGLSRGWWAWLALGATYAWCMCLGLLGAASRWLHAERAWVRWLADSSYWAYLVHLPVVILLQWAVAGSKLGAMTKFTFILGTTMAATLVSYGFLVRGRTVGRLLNGPRG